jgi:flagellar hook-basal body complex protein FliE
MSIEAIDPSALLAQLKQLESSGGLDKVSEGSEFSELMAQAVEKVNEAQHSATGMAQAFELGQTDASLAEVMIALQKASLSFQAMTEVRNRLVSAYQEIMNMPI